MFKQERGITLVALVVTIVVLLILAGVSISMVLGQNVIVTKAQDAKTNYTSSANEELTWMNTAIDWMKNPNNI